MRKLIARLWLILLCIAAVTAMVVSIVLIVRDAIHGNSEAIDLLKIIGTMVVGSAIIIMTIWASQEA